MSLACKTLQLDPEKLVHSDPPAVPSLKKILSNKSMIWIKHRLIFWDLRIRHLVTTSFKVRQYAVCGLWCCNLWEQHEIRSKCSWKVTSWRSALVFFDDSLRGGTDCYLLGFGQSEHSGGWILDHTVISNVETFFSAFWINAIMTWNMTWPPSASVGLNRF